jgi:hypothetical protein
MIFPAVAEQRIVGGDRGEQGRRVGCAEEQYLWHQEDVDQ